MQSGVADKITLLLYVKHLSSGTLSNDYDYVQRCEITTIVVAKLNLCLLQSAIALGSCEKTHLHIQY